MRRSGRRLLEHPSRRETSPRSLRHEGVRSPRPSTFTVNRTSFESGTLAEQGSATSIAVRLGDDVIVVGNDNEPFGALSRVVGGRRLERREHV